MAGGTSECQNDGRFWQKLIMKKDCFENVGVTILHCTIEAEAYGGSGDYGQLRFMSRM